MIRFEEKDIRKKSSKLPLRSIVSKITFSIYCKFVEHFYLKANYCLSFSFLQNYALKVKVINSFSAESAEFLSCRAGELITLIAKDCHRYDTVIVCFSAFPLLLLDDRSQEIACKSLTGS